MYTVRDLTSADMLGTLEKIAALGYQGIELAGYGNASRDEVIAKAAELGLVITGNHCGIDALLKDLDAVIEENKALNNTFLIVPFVSEEWRGSAQKWVELGQALDKLGQKLHEAGIQLCYHNHAFEFEEQYDGQYALDILYANADPKHLQAEIDCYWVQKGGATPAAYLRQYAGRIPLVHVKDMNEEGFFAEVGEGVLDWPAIFAAAEAGGTVTYVVEQDVCPGDPLVSIGQSIENLRKWGKLS
jgi:sugar phosphate isomerase/epimerase